MMQSGRRGSRYGSGWLCFMSCKSIWGRGSMSLKEGGKGEKKPRWEWLALWLCDSL